MIWKVAKDFENMNNSHTSPHFLGANRIETTSEAFLIDQHSTTFFKTPLKIALRSISLHTVAKWQILFKNKGHKNSLRNFGIWIFQHNSKIKNEKMICIKRHLTKKV